MGFGIAKLEESLLGKHGVPHVGRITNYEPRRAKGLESSGMVGNQFLPSPGSRNIRSSNTGGSRESYEMDDFRAAQATTNFTANERANKVDNWGDDIIPTTECNTRDLFDALYWLTEAGMNRFACVEAIYCMEACYKVRAFISSVATCIDSSIFRHFLYDRAAVLMEVKS